MENPNLRVISLGAGVQSTTLALMAAHGELGPMPDCAIFADTGDEKRGTYRHIEWLATRLPFPLIKIKRFEHSLSENTLLRYAGQPTAHPQTPPFFYPGGILQKQCSKEFKTRAVQAEIRRQLGILPGVRAPSGTKVEVWIGISRDEAHRMKPSEVAWFQNVWPLIDKNMRRSDCEKWLLSAQYKIPPRSACVYCPFQSDQEFKEMKENPDDDDWDRATTFDAAIRHGGGGTTGPLYCSQHLKPLSDVDFDRSPSMFGNECEGMCGV